MNKMAEIGIVVPVYNAERYLKTCIESILCQTFQNFEIILIDDGSTDTSRIICDEYASENKKIKVVHIEHKGVSTARNIGLNINNNEYITFIDADDYVDERYLETLYYSIRRNKADLVISRGKIVSENEMVRLRNSEYYVKKSKEHVISKSEAYKYMLTDRQIITSVWGKLYHKSLFQSIRYPDGEIYEDMKVIDKIIESSQTIVYISYAGYFYVQTSESITRGNVSLLHMTLLQNEEHLLEFIKKKYPEISNEAKKHYLWSCFFVLSILVLHPKYLKECQMLRNKIVVEWKFLIFSKYTSFLEKVATICLLFGVSFYRVVWKKCQNVVRKCLVI